MRIFFLLNFFNFILKLSFLYSNCVVLNGLLLFIYYNKFDFYPNQFFKVKNLLCLIYLSSIFFMSYNYIYNIKKHPLILTFFTYFSKILQFVFLKHAPLFVKNTYLYLNLSSFLIFILYYQKYIVLYYCFFL